MCGKYMCVGFFLGKEEMIFRIGLFRTRVGNYLNANKMLFTRDGHSLNNLLICPLGDT